jgi:hypothetical protein
MLPKASWYIDYPCHRILPIALQKYNITADWRQYSLYIVDGDQEHRLDLNEKPMIIIKQLGREGRKPQFVLRKIPSLLPPLPPSSPPLTPLTAIPASSKYSCRAKAIYSYQAKPGDAFEVSFQKHEIFQVVDVKGL